MTRVVRRSGLSALAVVLLNGSLDAQDADGSGAWAVAGGTLGLAAGAMAGNVGSLLPCTQTPFGARCVATVTVLGGVVGVTTGIAIGVEDPELIRDRATSGLIAFGAGVGIAVLGSPFFQRIGLPDVLAVGLATGAMGTQPRGSLVGLVAGTGLGLGLWQLVPGFEAPDVIAASLAGVTVGVLVGWINGAIDVQGSGRDPVPLFSLTLPL